MLRRIADAMILEPSREAIAVKQKSRRTLEHGGDLLDVWVERIAQRHADDTELFVLKLGGAGSRAERTTAHPLDFWTDIPAEVWGINWPGYGASSGRATLSAFAPAAMRAYEEIHRVAAGRPVLVTGNSLGSAVALSLAATRRDMQGLLLRNPPPLRQLIVGKHGWWNAWAPAWLVAQQIPRDLCAITNARGSDVPALFVTSGRDRIVPPAFQQGIFEHYAGPKNRIVLPDADHADPPSERDVNDYRQSLAWLRQQMFAGATDRVAAGNRQAE
jgi:pimeloyl-ACP methyl ester carboxylesterase